MPAGAPRSLYCGTGLRLPRFDRLREGSSRHGLARTIEASRGHKIIVYEPRVTSFKGRELSANAATAIQPPGDDEPTFGAIWFERGSQDDLQRQVRRDRGNGSHALEVPARTRRRWRRRSARSWSASCRSRIAPGRSTASTRVSRPRRRRPPRRRRSGTTPRKFSFRPSPPCCSSIRGSRKPGPLPTRTSLVWSTRTSSSRTTAEERTTTWPTAPTGTSRRIPWDRGRSSRILPLTSRR
jgi:hypothetical protein